jgi:hypothetical protein
MRRKTMYIYIKGRDGNPLTRSRGQIKTRKHM